MKVKDIMTRGVESVSPQSSIQEAAEFMRELDVGIIPVVDEGVVAGLLTDRDIAVRFVAEGRDFSGTSVADIMSREVLYCFEEQDAIDAARLMEERQIRRLPVLDRGRKLVGIISLGDIARRMGDRSLSGEALEKISQPTHHEPSATGPVTGSAASASSTLEPPATRDRQSAGLLRILVRDELAAVETYRQALGKVADHPSASELRRIETDHEEAVALLQEQMAQLGEPMPSSSGAWGAFARAFEGTAKIFGNRAAIRALKTGEEHGVNDYERALHDDALEAAVKSLISARLLPKTRAHIPVLEHFLQRRVP
ncbi:MAG: CBS domain-containing protein [Elusimicrobia bacterium]|nr:CBS domain-containing protein [Elusimicrobiota bacterium]